VPYRRKKLTFDISSPDEFLYSDIQDHGQVSYWLLLFCLGTLQICRSLRESTERATKILPLVHGAAAVSRRRQPLIKLQAAVNR